MTFQFICTNSSEACALPSLGIKPVTSLMITSVSKPTEHPKERERGWRGIWCSQDWYHYVGVQTCGWDRTKRHTRCLSHASKWLWSSDLLNISIQLLSALVQFRYVEVRQLKLCLKHTKGTTHQMVWRYYKKCLEEKRRGEERSDFTHDMISNWDFLAFVVYLDPIWCHELCRLQHNMLNQLGMGP